MKTIATDPATHVPLRDMPSAPWSRVGWTVLLLIAISLSGWELYWRVGQEYVPAYRDGFGLWSMVFRRIEKEPTGSIAIVGSSRVLFDMELGVWERETGRGPIQLALAGTNPRPIMNHLARETDFAGLLLVGVTPPLFFTPPVGGVFDGAPEYARDETPSQRFGQRVSMLVEPYLGFYNFDTALFLVLRRQYWWPERTGFQGPPRDPRRLESSRIDRQSDMWHRVEDDPEMRSLAQNIWLGYLGAAPPPPPPEVAAQMLDDIMVEVADNVRLIRARGGEVVFARMPSTDEFREVERMAFPREVFWDRLLVETDGIGIHFEDYQELQDVRVPEWSHIHSDDTAGFTERFIAILRAQAAAGGTQIRELGS
jgi:hypothetical protein